LILLKRDVFTEITIEVMVLVLGVEIAISQEYKFQETKSLLAEAIPMFITRDDVVSQRLKFGGAFLWFPWESKIALFF